VPGAGFKVQVSFTLTRFLQALLELKSIDQNVTVHLAMLSYRKLLQITSNYFECQKLSPDNVPGRMHLDFLQISLNSYEFQLVPASGVGG
jgi:hypothetical protein